MYIHVLRYFEITEEHSKLYRYICTLVMDNEVDRT